ncbi:hypothetical protein CNMCM8694_004227 [Aspergillus lentulus]|nr:hypothetical protein CNMCM8060_004363 [Aspergillus lentulus]KAF4186513.1 hypothetical protein CNMCM7927_005336 [Aspergillus lentulus]KAF4189390.1 hypothetical protein CNMCM8694_004227 [Aspergillus lentulus]
MRSGTSLPVPAVLCAGSPVVLKWTLHATASIAGAALSIKTNLFENSGPGIPPQNDDRHAMRAFSYCPRSCIAHVLVWLEMRLVLARLIWEVDWELAPRSDWKVAASHAVTRRTLMLVGSHTRGYIVVYGTKEGDHWTFQATLNTLVFRLI